MPSGIDPQEIVPDFKKLVNMDSKELSEWLETDVSQSVGWTGGEGGESVGHHSGRYIVELLEKDGDYSEEDLAHMKKVRGYIKRHLAQHPSKDIENTKWRHSLMNWGHDPMKDE